MTMDMRGGRGLVWFWLCFLPGWQSSLSIVQPLRVPHNDGDDGDDGDDDDKGDDYDD